MRTRTRRILLGAVIALVAIQLVPVWLWQTDPPVVREPPWDSPATKALARAACFDCHSNQTVWPWYARIAPASWLVTRDVVAGRGRLNFSEWGGPQARQAELVREVAKAVRSGDMPPLQFRLMHPAARLTAAQRDALVRGLERSLAPAAPAAPLADPEGRERE